MKLNYELLLMQISSGKIDKVTQHKSGEGGNT